MSKSEHSTVLFDALGPKGRARVRVQSVISAVVILGILGYAAYQLNLKGFFEQTRWVDPLDAIIFEQTWIPAFLNTLQAAGLGCVGAVVLGAVIGFGRISRFAVLRFLSGVYVQFFRAMPVLLLIWIPFTVMNSLGNSYDGFWYVVIGLAVYNGAVLAEILRSGVNALPEGQAMAGHAIGLRHGQVTRLIVFPQAFRNMLPAVLAQLVVLMKDTALGYIVVYDELLHAAGNIADFYGNSYLQAFIIAALVYFAIAYTLSKIITIVERRLRRKVPSEAKPVTPAPDLQQSGAAVGAV